MFYSVFLHLLTTTFLLFLADFGPDFWPGFWQVWGRFWGGSWEVFGRVLEGKTTITTKNEKLYKNLFFLFQKQRIYFVLVPVSICRAMHAKPLIIFDMARAEADDLRDCPGGQKIKKNKRKKQINKTKKK